MPRRARKNYPNQYYHIFNRGFDRKNIFKLKNDYFRFLKKLSELVTKHDWIIYSYTLLPNHYHIHAQIRNDSLSKIIHSLQTSHSVYFNKKHKHFGPVFTGRFKSILIQKENYHLSLSKYIHQNPVKAGLVKRPQDYPYSSYSEIINQPKHPYKIIDKRSIKSLTSSLSKKSIKQYRGFVEDKKIDYDPSLAKRGILGTKRFCSQFE
jgi:REP element-mobilizing transposase RayT